jgi:hypothetical protein
VGDIEMDARDCLCMAAQLDGDGNGHWWYALAKMGGGVVGGVSHTTVQCLTAALTGWYMTPLEWHVCAWAELASGGGGTVDGGHWSVAECLARCIEAADAVRKRVPLSDATAAVVGDAWGELSLFPDAERVVGGVLVSSQTCAREQDLRAEGGQQPSRE